MARTTNDVFRTLINEGYDHRDIIAAIDSFLNASNEPVDWTDDDVNVLTNQLDMSLEPGE